MSPFVTAHAVERFRQHWAGGLCYSHARRELILLSQAARPLRQRTVNGQELWETGDVDKIWLVVKHDDGRAIVVTVLHAGASEDT